ncbi:hypothetical protein B7R22_02920 [Subtercola boreus]|uniref:Uncharacterized protein n=1 Tax=Subtercola boreus TaxID=120213 RepID=A0A3E0W3T5_9MICO|nr:hypothetical protein B7R22_02920 [Subtercola boreus]
MLGSTTYAPAIRRVMNAGAHSFVLNEDSPETIAEAVAAASRNEVFVPAADDPRRLDPAVAFRSPRSKPSPLPSYCDS